MWAGQVGMDPAGPVSLCPSHGSPCPAVQALGPGSLGWGLPEGAEGRRVQGAGLDLHMTLHTAHQTVPYFGNPSTSSWLKCVLEHTRSSPVPAVSLLWEVRALCAACTRVAMGETHGHKTVLQAA